MKRTKLFGETERIICGGGWITNGKAAYRWELWKDVLQHLPPDVRATVQQRPGAWRINYLNGCKDPQETDADCMPEFESFIPEDGTSMNVEVLPIMVDGCHVAIVQERDGETDRYAVLLPDVPAIRDGELCWWTEGLGKPLVGYLGALAVALVMPMCTSPQLWAHTYGLLERALNATRGTIEAEEVKP